MALEPSTPMSSAETANSMKPAEISSGERTAVFGVANGDPPSSNSMLSLALTVGPKATRTVIPASASVVFRKPSATLAVPVSLGATGGVGTTVSFSKTRAGLAGPRLPTASVMSADRLLKPSTPRSACEITKSTRSLAMSVPVRTTARGHEPNVRDNRSVNVSPATAPVPERLTLIVVWLAASMRLSFPSASLVEPASAGWAGAVGACVSLRNVNAPLTTLTPFTSVSRAARALLPSAPRSAVVTRKSTKPSTAFAGVNTTVFAVVNALPLRSRSTVSPAIAPVPLRPTRIQVAVAASAKFRLPSASLAVACSTGANGVGGDAVSLTNGSEPLWLPGLPAWSMARALSALGPSTPRFAVVSVNSTYPFATSPAPSVSGFPELAGANGTPFKSNSTWSPTTVPETPRPTRKIVSVCESAVPYLPSVSFPVPISTGAFGAAGPAVSFVNVNAEVAAPGFPAASVTRAVIDFAPSAARSEAETEKSTKPLERSSGVNTTFFAGVKPTPLSRSVIVSPTTAPEEPRLTRMTMGVASSAEFAKASASLVLPVSAGVPGAIGAEVSFVNERGGVPEFLTLPDWSMIRAERALRPSLPRSAVETVNRTKPCEISTAVMGAIFAVLNGEPLTSNSSVSFTAAPMMLTRTVVVVAASEALSHPSANLVVPTSRGEEGTAGNAVSNSKTRLTLTGPAFPTASVMKADMALRPSSPRSGACTTKSR